MQAIVIKRDGKKEPFKVSKLKMAVERCCKAAECPSQEYQTYLKTFMDRFPIGDAEEINVEDIQDWVIADMKEHLSKEVADAYSEYRDFHAKVRDAKYNKKFYDTILEITTDSRKATERENANKDASQSYVIRDLIAGETSKKLYRELVMPEKIKKLHDKGVIHVHDCDYRILGSLSNCCLLNLEDVLKNGTVINGKMIEQPNSLKTAATLATQVVAAVASSQYGGISISIAHLAPYIRKSRERYMKLLQGTLSNRDELNKAVETLVSKEIEDAVQTITYQLNTLYTSSGQSPFVSIWLYVNEYPEYEKETALLIEEVLKQRIEGMKSPSGHIINPTFPKLIYCLSEKNISRDSEYFYLTELACECTAKRMVPDYISEKVMRQLKGGDVFPSMGCRSFLTPYKDEDGNFKHWGRLNLGVISLNIPYVALESKDIDDFYKRLEKYARIICDEQLRIAETISDSPTARSPIMWNYGAIARLPEGSKIGDILRTHKGYATISLGYCGIAEAVYRFGIDYVSEEGHAMGIKILEILNKVTDEYKAKTPYDFGVYGTPSESLTTKFASVLKRFKKIPMVNDKTYVTNSYHVPVTVEITCFDKLAFEKDLQALSTGGRRNYTASLNSANVLSTVSC